MSGQHRATPEQWERIKQLAKDDWEVQSVIYELCNRVEQLEAALLSLTSTVAKAGNDHKSRIEALEATQHGSVQTTCPHIASSDEGTSYCRLAEQGSAPASAEARPGGLVEQVASICANGSDDEPEVWDNEARAAIRAVAAWLRTGRLLHAAELLELEADR